MTFDGAADTTSTELSFPVPLGLAPLALNATLQLPVTLRSGNRSVDPERPHHQPDRPATHRPEPGCRSAGRSGDLR